MVTPSSSPPPPPPPPPPSLSFQESLSLKERNDLSLRLEAFVTPHASMQRPVALVSSGGTVADLELHSVRCLDNFSTGLRGAISVECLLRRGYAVIHLWRRGSASPFARVLAQQLGLPPHSALDMNAIGKLFLGGNDHDNGDDDEQGDYSLKELLRKEDPWLTRSHLDAGKMQENFSNDHHPEKSMFGGGLNLSRGVAHSSQVQKALRERKSVLRENRLLTISFRSVEEYLAKLQLCSEAIHSCQSLALTYLAAAVSDFYIPLSERSEHKLQSTDHYGEDGLVLHLKPVPKTIGLLRSQWAPDAFCVSFKLETDETILRQKAERAVQKYGVHLVIGNILETRHDKVWILMPETQDVKTPENAQDWILEEVARPSSSHILEDLEDLILDKVVESHFEFISFHMYGQGIEEAQKTRDALKERKKRLQQQLFWKRASAVGTEMAGYILSGILSWAVASAIQRARRAL